MKKKLTFRLLALPSIAVLLLLGMAPAVHSQSAPSAVYTMTNSAAGNSVLAFNRAPSGMIFGAPATYPTGG